MDTAGGQIQGARRRQEDAWAVQRVGEDGWLLLLADGLGGHPAGDIASREAAAEFGRAFLEHAQQPDSSPRAWMHHSVLAAEQHLRRRQVADRALLGMSTTLVALYARDREAYALSVGDSYLMLLRNGVLRRLNELHTHNGAVTSCLGFSLTRVDLSDALATAPGDRFLLASDGVDTLDDATLTRIVASAPDAPSVVRDLLAAIESAGNPVQDNATAVALTVA